MTRKGPIIAGLGIACAVLTGCAASEPVADADFAPQYNGIETLLLDGDLVSFRVEMTGPRGKGQRPEDEGTWLSFCKQVSGLRC